MERLTMLPWFKFSPTAPMISLVFPLRLPSNIAAFDSGVPLALRCVEILGIETSRYWKTATLNEFRRFFGLIEHKKFEDINPDPKMATKLRQLYDHPDNVELYPGLIIEETKKPMGPGSGLCPPQTVGKAILSDAVSLVRGDRFYTVVCLSLLD
jgi:Animal haem peroxidase